MRHGMAAFGGFIGMGLFGYLFQFLLSRRLTVAQYGEFQSLIAVSAILGVVSAALSYFVLLHTSVFARQGDVTATRAFLRSMERWMLPAFGVLAVVFLAFTPVVRGLLHLSSVWGFWIVCAATLVSLLVVLYQGTLTGWEEFFVVSMIASGGAALKLAAAVPIAWRYPEAAPVMGAVLVGAVGTWVGMRLALRRRLAARPAAGPGHANWKEGYFSGRAWGRDFAIVAAFTLLITLLQNLDMLLVKYRVAADLAGYYGAFSLAGKIVLSANLGIITIVLPTASASAHYGERLAGHVRRTAYGLIVAVSGSALVLYALAPRVVVGALFGARYVPSASVLWLFAVVALCASLFLLEANIAFARREPRMLAVLGATLALLVGALTFAQNTLPALAQAQAVALGAGFIAALAVNRAQKRAAAPADAPTL